MTKPPRVFVSYSHDSPEHAERVLAFTQELRANGIDARIDRFVQGPPGGWPRWIQQEIQEADFVLMVCSETYRRRFERGEEDKGVGLGVTWEGFLANQILYERRADGEWCLPVLLDSADPGHVPTVLRPFTQYRWPDGLVAILRRLTGQPEIVARELGPLPELPARDASATAPIEPPSLRARQPSKPQAKLQERERPRPAERSTAPTRPAAAAATPAPRRARVSATPGTGVPASPSNPVRKPPPAPLAEPKQRWRRAAFAAAALFTALFLAGLLKSRWGRGGGDEPPGVFAATPGTTQPVELATDPASKSLHPKDWEVVDGTLGVEGLATMVRHPRSGIVFRLVKPGEFLMGSPESEPERGADETQHNVRLTRPFYLGVTEVTIAQATRLGAEPSSSDLPVQIATWGQARAICRTIGCDLPTEAQWEYAARAETTGRWWWGDSPDDAQGMANLLDSDGAQEFGSLQVAFRIFDGYAGPAPVGKFKPNPFGFHDMIGNVWEWCLDDYEGDYGPAEAVDPRVEFDGSRHVARGGSFSTPLPQTRAASRLSWGGSVITHEELPAGMQQQAGFRAALTLP